MLNHKKDIITIIAAIILITTKLIVWYIAPQAIVLWVVLLSVITFLLHPIRHNHTHLPVFASSAHNRVFDLAINFATLSSAVGIHVIHVLNHHRHNDREKDWGRTTIYTHRWELINYLTYLFLGSAKMVKGYKKWIKTSNTLNKKRNQLETAVLYGLVLLMLFFKPIDTLVFWIIPAITSFLILVSFNYFQHRGCDSQSEYNHSRNFTGKVMNLLVFNTGYHTVHHLYPDKHWSEYPALHQQIKGAISMELNYKYVAWYFINDILFSIRLKQTQSS